MSFKTKMVIKLIFVFVIGAAMIAAGIIRDSLLLSTGTTAVIIGITLALKFLFMSRKPGYWEQMEISSHDERTVFVAQKSYSFAFWLSMVAEFVAVCVQYWFSMYDTAMILNYVICFQAVAYVASYLFFNKKY